MNASKEIDLLRRRNIALTSELEEAKDKYDELKFLNSESAKRAKALIVELEEIKDDWLATMADLHEKQEECSKLLAVLREMKLIMEEPMEEQKKASLFSRLFGKLREI